MNNSKKYILLLVALLSGTFLYGELWYKLPGGNQHSQAARTALFSHTGKELVDTYENIIAFNYDDSCIVVFKGPVDIFLRETYRFGHGIDAVKYWYDKVSFMGIDPHGFPDTENDIWIRTSVGVGPNHDLFNDLFYYNGDCLWRIEPDFGTILSYAAIYSNEMIISKAHIGDSARRVIELLDLETPVPTKGLRSIVLSYTADVVSSYLSSKKSALDFDRNSIEYRSNYHPTASDKASFYLDADTLRSIVIGDIEGHIFLRTTPL